MITTVRNQVARLEPIKDTVVLSPMSDEELKTLETAVGVPMPTCVREYLRLVGYETDLTSYHDAAEYEIHHRFDDFVRERKDFVQLFGDKAGTLFPFAGDGAGDYIVAGEGNECSALFFADHETKRIRELGTFCEWLEKVVNASLMSKRPLNDRKRHFVQFSFRTQTPEPILEVLKRFAPASLGEWTKEPRSASGVDPSHAPLTLGTQPLRMGRLEYHTWESPMFSFDYSAAVTVPAEGARLRKMDEAFRTAGLRYALVDYGILDSAAVDKLEKEEEERKAAVAAGSGAGKKRRWWAWW